jgi:hypothetical protein
MNNGINGINNNGNNQVLEEFNKTLDEFIKKMIVQFPQETKLKTYYSAFKVTKMYDKTMPIKIYMGGCLQFTEQIKSRDTNFFAKRPEFVNKIKQCSSFTDDTGLVNYWENLSENSKNAIWDYIQTLFVMGEMYINKDTSIIQKINSVYSNMSFDESLKDLEENKTISENLMKKINGN